MDKPPEIEKLEWFYQITIQEVTRSVFEEHLWWPGKRALFFRGTQGEVSGLFLRQQGIKDVSALASLTALTQLDLSNNQVSDVSALASLTALTHLDLNNNQVSDISPLASLTALTQLNLNNNQMLDVSALVSLAALTQLNLDINLVTDVSALASLTAWTRLDHGNLVTDVSALASLTALTQLDLRNNQVSDVSALANLTALTQLDLRNNQVSDVSALASLTALSQLDLPNNQVSDVSALASLTALSQLDLPNNQVSDVSALASLTALTRLYLDNNQVSDVSALASLTALTRLDLRNNQVSDVSALASLTALTRLDLTNNQNSDVSALASLTALTRLDLTNNQVSDVSALASLTALIILNLYNNQVSDVSALASLTALTILLLSNNQVSDVSALASLTALTRLDLDNNQVSDVSPLLPLFKGQLTDFSLDHNPLSRPPKEIVEKGRDAIVAWLDSEQAGTTILNEVKVLLVGAGGVGKTSLVRSLTGKPFNPQEVQTPGIAVTKKTFACAGDVAVTAHLWDFGGQEIMHATHQFFLSRRSLYLLLLNSRIDDGSEEYWLKLIASFGGDSPVFVVFSHYDQNPGFDINRRSLKEKYPNIQGFFPLSNQSGEGLPALQHALCALLPKLELVQTVWPRSWLNVKQSLATLPEAYIGYDRFRNLCRKNAVVVEEFQDRLLEYLHELGVALFYRDLEWLNTQVLKPEWVTEPVYALINHAEVAKAHGLVHNQHLPKLLPEFPQDKLPFLGKLMAKFEICHPIEPDQLLFPDLLPKDKPELPFDEHTALRLEIRYHFLPRALLPRLMVRLYTDIQHHADGRYQWREGVLFHHPDLNSQALVQADYDQRQITIQTSGKHRRDYLATILRILRVIQATYHKIEAQELVPCICPECRASSQAQRFAYQKVLQLEDKGKKTIGCHHSGEDVPIRGLLEGFYGPNEVMILASPEDAAWARRLQYLFALGQDIWGLKTWSQGNIGSGDSIREAYASALARAQALVVLVSLEYYADPDLRDLQRRIEQAQTSGLLVTWLPIGSVPAVHAFKELQPLTPSEPLRLLKAAEADKVLAEAAQAFAKQLGQKNRSR